MVDVDYYATHMQPCHTGMDRLALYITSVNTQKPHLRVHHGWTDRLRCTMHTHFPVENIVLQLPRAFIHTIVISSCIGMVIPQSQVLGWSTVEFANQTPYIVKGIERRIH